MGKSNFDFRISSLARRAGRIAFLCCLSVTPIFRSPDAWARELPPAPLAPKPIVLPTPAVRVLPNGLKLLVVERHALPLLTLRVVVKAGAEADPPELAGTAELVAAVLNQGTTRRSARAIAEAIDSAGGTMTTGAAWDNSFASLSVLADSTELAFDLLADMIIRPAFAPAEIERRRQQTLSALKVARDDPSYVADAAFRRLIFAGTAYSHPEDGTTETVQRITAQGLKDFHARYYRPSNCFVAVVGDISAEEAFERAEKAFGSWEGGPAPSAIPATVPAIDTRQIIVIDKPDAVQTEIRIGNPAVRRDSPDYYALAVANQVLGGPGGNRLFEALRSQQGLTYSASSELLCYRNAGSWMAKTFTRTGETVKSVERALEQMKRLRDRSVSEQDRDTAQGYLIGHLALDFESSGDVATRFLELLVEGLPLDYWNRFPDNIRAIQAEDVRSAARRFLDPKRNVIVLVGNAAGFRDELKNLGRYRVIPLPSLDFASEDLERTTPGAAGKR